MTEEDRKTLATFGHALEGAIGVLSRVGPISVDFRSVGTLSTLKVDVAPGPGDRVKFEDQRDSAMKDGTYRLEAIGKVAGADLSGRNAEAARARQVDRLGKLIREKLEETSGFDEALSGGVRFTSEDRPVVRTYVGVDPAGPAGDEAAFVAVRRGVSHVLYTAGDADAPAAIKDSNGEVVLGLCRLCGRGEAELDLDDGRCPVGALTVEDLGEPTESTFTEATFTWLLECFGVEISTDHVERRHRFLEEALELFQACDGTLLELVRLAIHVFSRPAGEVPQEVGGVAVTLAALCAARNLDAEALAEAELERVWGKIDRIREKQKAKPDFRSSVPASSDEQAAANLLATAARRKRIAAEYREADKR